MSAARPLVLCAILLLTGCMTPDDAGPATTDTTPGSGDLPAWKARFLPDSDDWRQSEQHLRFNNDAEPNTLDPQLSAWVHDGRIALALFEGLVGNDPADLSIRPGVAHSWEIDDDGRRYRFHLRPEAAWSDGTPLRAQDFVASWRRVLDPSLAASYAYMLFPIAGAEDYYTGVSDDPDTVGVTAEDDHTLLVTLHRPCPWFLDLCAFATLYPVRVDLIQQHGESWTRPGNLVGNGPFRLESWQPRQSLVMTKNLHYWDADFVKLERITAYPYDDAEAALRRYESEALDWLTSVPQERVETLRHRSDYYAAPYLGTYFYRFNCSRPPFDDARVRRAFSLAIDRRAITDHVTRAGEIPATWFCPPMAGYQPTAGLDEDLDEARRLLLEAGYGPERPFPEVELWFNTSENHRRIAEALADRWQRQLGVRVLLRNSDAQSFFARMRSLDYDIARSAWIGDYNDPNTFYDCFVSDGGNNRTGWSHERYDELLEQSQIETDPDTRRQIFHAMERILVEEELPIMPIYTYVTKGMLRERVRGLIFNNRAHHPFHYIWIED